MLSETEKIGRDQIVRSISQISSLTEEEKTFAIDEEKNFKIVLESTDNLYVDHFTLQGESEMLLNEMIYLQGIEPKLRLPENEDYVRYLKLLNERGLL